MLSSLDGISVTQGPLNTGEISSQSQVIKDKKLLAADRHHCCTKLLHSLSTTVQNDPDSAKDLT